MKFERTNLALVAGIFVVLAAIFVSILALGKVFEEPPQSRLKHYETRVLSLESKKVQEPLSWSEQAELDELLRRIGKLRADGVTESP